ncbi:sodium:solute symporter [Pinibacter soli]|uniref:Sodium:solute symporter n=1 Tax=Pinibacter soli TaxID=3044211 RepID=A0ABT6RI56_9BACT|nr:sodium:solute symporter [Pinibacter soli]MDI3322065.1 sodium:solute symporter [Pinibacter soli]
MSFIDWIVLAVTLLIIIGYGLYKSRTTKNLDGYFLSNRSMPWYLILLSIMGTQASAITFLSAPGQAYTDGMRFVQYYFGLPLAMVVLCITFVPVFHRLKIYTAYEYLEERFDLKTRTLTSFLFLLQRGLSTGISIYAPSIILSSLLGWNIYWTNIFMGGLLIIYTVTGGAKAVAYTQQLQLIIIFAGMFLAAYMVVHLLPEGVGFIDALKVSGKLGKLNVITTGNTEKGFNWSDRYNIWSGLIGGFFLALSYFGTDQSQVGRYLTAKNVSESKTGLLMNGIVKVPMQFLILLIGALIFTFYQFNQAPIFFNQAQVNKLAASPKKDTLRFMEQQYNLLSAKKKELSATFVQEEKHGSASAATINELRNVNAESEKIRTGLKDVLKKEVGGDTSDTNYIFIRFVVDYLPKGLVGLLIAVIFLASWGSIAAALNSLASSTVVDIHKKFINTSCTEFMDYSISRYYSLGWGIFCIVIAQFANNMGSLIEAVNVLGSLFYGVILGIFLVAFYCKSVKGNAVFASALIVELAIILLFWKCNIGFLWLNLIGALGVVVIALIIHATFNLLKLSKQ